MDNRWTFLGAINHPVFTSVQWCVPGALCPHQCLFNQGSLAPQVPPAIPQFWFSTSVGFSILCWKNHKKTPVDLTTCFWAMKAECDPVFLMGETYPIIGKVAVLGEESQRMWLYILFHQLSSTMEIPLQCLWKPLSLLLKRSWVKEKVFWKAHSQGTVVGAHDAFWSQLCHLEERLPCTFL